MTSKHGSGILHSAQTGNPRDIMGMTHSSTGSDDSSKAHDQAVQWSGNGGAVPENADAAIAEVSKAMQEKGRIRSMADQERETLTLHTQARDVYFEAAQRAYERGTLDSAYAFTLLYFCQTCTAYHSHLAGPNYTKLVTDQYTHALFGCAC